MLKATASAAAAATSQATSLANMRAYGNPYGYMDIYGYDKGRSSADVRTDVQNSMGKVAPAKGTEFLGRVPCRQLKGGNS